ncbi:unnamed protein product [Porites evermanni]|uniref:Uncharacterized protein n=1 Tax=Porites evermanni TaxID=104178 RepID=A0ABN8LED9_9CNID|nr:unnamed protein product [Porites evermanni]
MNLTSMDRWRPGVQVKEGDISTSHPLPTFKEDAPPKIIVKFTRRDMRNSFYTNPKEAY